MKPADLNLLLHLDALVTCRNLSRAATQMGVTQPAMSAALSRLRRLFNDPLLITGQGAVEVTDRALELHREFGPLLETWRRVTAPRDIFDAETPHTFTLYASDYLQFAWIPKLVSALDRETPAVRLRVVTARPNHGLAMLASNHAEFVAGYYPTPSDDLRARPLFEEPVLSLVRRDHPCLREEWTIDTWLAYRHIDLAAHTRNYSERLDLQLQDMKRKRVIGLTLASYLAAPFTVAETDFIATVPKSVAMHFSKHLDVVALEPPIELPSVKMSLYWHERYQTDPAHAWLRHFFFNRHQILSA
ncbi:LysR family transcriptional regulator [Caballeronia sordidicola]|uniref:LysR family transcriptional regulator n=1 Tax=Caballeronia sordidicola TaxID=196367 RepID=A0A158FH48_CABSO|nr:LysR family transcriptional regulator [Caballeronia sordidicola]SAL18659.1 LysR family transcriptional regulator [Caballeronia sordidicola]